MLWSRGYSCTFGSVVWEWGRRFHDDVVIDGSEKLLEFRSVLVKVSLLYGRSHTRFYEGLPLAGLKKNKFEKRLKIAGIPCRYYCRRSHATLDILLPSEELAVKLAGNSTTKYFWLQTEDRGKRRKKSHRVQRLSTAQWRRPGFVSQRLWQLWDYNAITIIERDSARWVRPMDEPRQGKFPSHPKYHHISGSADDGCCWQQETTLLVLEAVGSSGQILP